MPPLDSDRRPPHEEPERASAPLDSSGNEIVFGDIRQTPDGFELYRQTDEAEARECAMTLVTRMKTLACKAGINIYLHRNPVRLVFFDDETDSFSVMSVSRTDELSSERMEAEDCEDADDNITLHIRTNSSRGAELRVDMGYRRVEGLLFADPDIPARIMISASSYGVEVTPQYTRFFWELPDDVNSEPDLMWTTTSILSQFSGEPIDPFEVLYGWRSEGWLIREFLGKSAVVDAEQRKVVSMFSKMYTREDGTLIYAAIEENYDEVLADAREAFKRSKWMDMETLAQRLNCAYVDRAESQPTLFPAG